MKVCVLQPDYSTTDVDYKNYDPPRNLSNLLPGDKVEHVFLNKLHTYSQLKSLAKEGYDIFVNLCEGYLEWPVPSIEVPYFLELFQLPYTGPDCRVYDPAKQLMKYVAFTAGVRTPPFAILNSLSNIRDCIGHLSFPLFLKPAKAGDSLGIDEKSLVHDLNELTPKFVELLAEFGEVLIEEYIEGREFTVLVVADINGKDCDAYTPLEYIFSGKDKFKTYALKTRELHPEANVLCIDPLLKERLQTAAREIFIAFGGVGYARLDFRLNQGNQLYFLDINFTCSVFYTDGYEGSADYILKNDANGLDGFLKKVISEGISRYQRTLPLYKVQGSPVSGYGIYALRHILKNEIVFRGEGRSQRQELHHPHP